MSNIKMTLNVLLSLIIQSKVTGKGMVGNGKLYIKFMKVIADNDSAELSAEKNILNKFNNEIVEKEAYHKLDRFISRFLKDGKGYPYKIIRFNEFENSIGNTLKIHDYLRKIELVCDEIIDCTKLDSLVYTLLEILRQDNSIKKVLYGSEYIPKNKLFGSYAHPKRICVEALIMGLLYHIHKKPAKSENTELLNAPDRLKFHVVRFSDEKPLDLEMPTELIENIHENTKRQKPEKMKYSLELRNEDKMLTEIPDSGNVFLYGVGGAGKSTLLLNQIRNENTVNFYLPLYQYKKEIHENLQSGSCWILLNILLKYHYQYEYPTYETCSACEGDNVVLQQLTELNWQLKDKPDNWKAGYVLLLNGLNEMPSELQEDFAVELSCIVNKWKNVRIIVTGRNVPEYDVFEKFQLIEAVGIPDKERDKSLSVLPDFDIISGKENLMDILKIPMFLNMYLESQKSDKMLETRGEILDSYITTQSCQYNDVMRFILKYVLPFVAKRMFIWEYAWDFIPFLKFSYDISRADVLDAIDEAIKFYLMNSRIYQNFIAPQKINKKHIIRFRRNSDMVEIILEQLCFMQTSIWGTHKLCFSHQYYRDYFAAKHILNLIDAIDISYENNPKKRATMLEESELTGAWYGGFAWYDFGGSQDVYRLIGEICGDYKNIASDNFVYHRTALDRLLDMIRDYQTYQIAENVIITMSLVRNNVICGVDFSKMKIPTFLPEGIYFSNNGLNPSSFRKSIVACMIKYENKNFLNCDFREAFIWNDAENLISMGAILDDEIALIKTH